MMLVEKVVATLLRVLSVLGSCLFRLFFGSGWVLFFLGLVVLIVIRAVVGVGRLGPLVHVACFASRAAFSRMSVWSCLCYTRALFALCTLSVVI